MVGRRMSKPVSLFGVLPLSKSLSPVLGLSNFFPLNVVIFHISLLCFILMTEAAFQPVVILSDAGSIISLVHSRHLLKTW